MINTKGTAVRTIVVSTYAVKVIEVLKEKLENFKFDDKFSQDIRKASTIPGQHLVTLMHSKTNLRTIYTLTK